ncbi:hypothetical protein DPEC_G00072340 [Dallia pectoralis]|uniref:Uncharacterized protein n=1 Tax=Dallia pectoralis TaxID=75939 RepID=A0ACC2H2D4_DALPE|nr:hypothetical protein DPEC_G00072340 [Dallia pectoralis]
MMIKNHLGKNVICTGGPKNTLNRVDNLSGSMALRSVANVRVEGGCAFQHKDFDRRYVSHTEVVGHTLFVGHDV